MDDVLAGLRTAPPSADLIERARRPLLESYDNALQGSERLDQPCRTLARRAIPTGSIAGSRRPI